MSGQIATRRLRRQRSWNMKISIYSYRSSKRLKREWVQTSHFGRSVEASMQFMTRLLVSSCIVQADIDSAFRRIPIKPEHRPYSNIVFKCNHHTIIARHLSLMFGSVASVHHWERVGNTFYYFNKQSAKIGARNGMCKVISSKLSRATC